MKKESLIKKELELKDWKILKLSIAKKNEVDVLKRTLRVWVAEQPFNKEIKMNVNHRSNQSSQQMPEIEIIPPETLPASRK